MKNAITLLIILLVVAPQVHAQTKEEKAEAKKQKKLKMKYVFWEECFVVKANGDTAFGKLKPTDYTLGTTYSNENFTGGSIRLAYVDGHEETFKPGSFKEVYFYKGHPEYQHFVAVPNKIGENKILRVVVEGKCQLLHREVITPQTGMTLVGAGSTATHVGGGPDEKAQFYYLYSNNTLTRVHLEKEAFMTGEKFRKECDGLFSECPALAQQLKNQGFRSNDLREVVKEYNNCLEKK